MKPDLPREEVGDALSLTLQAVSFSPAEIVQTRNGPFILRKGCANAGFLQLWAKRKSELVNHGFMLSTMFGADGVVWWRPAPQIEDPLAQGETDTDFDPPVPEGFTLKPFQRAGVEHCFRRWKEGKHGAIIADEMGLGKTPQAAVFTNTIGASNILIACPASLKLNWEREMALWSTQDLPVTIIHTGKDEIPDGGVVIVNYDLVSAQRARLRKVNWDVTICDEAHMLANPAAARTGALIGPRSGAEGVPSKFWLMLTGTPMPNRPIELQPLLRKTEPEVFSNRADFSMRFCDFEICGNNKGASNLHELRGLLKPVMIRRLKVQVMKDLPPRTFKLIPLPPSQSMKMVLDRERQAWGLTKEAEQEIAERIASAKSDGDLSAVLSALRPKSVTIQGHLMAERAELGLAKVDQIVEQVRDAWKTDDKVVVMVNHRAVVDRLAARLGDMNPVFLHGGVTKRLRQEAVDRFQNDPDCHLFVGTIRAAGVGLTLTASATMVFGELDWTPAWVQQAADRVHRIGQVRPVMVRILAVEGSIDQIMAQLLVRKAGIAHEALDSKAPTTRRTRVVSTTTGMRIVKPSEVKCLLWAGRRLLSQSNRADGNGFSRFDAPKARVLWSKEDPEPDEVQEMARILRKYRKQLRPDELNIVN